MCVKTTVDNPYSGNQGPGHSLAHGVTHTLQASADPRTLVTLFAGRLAVAENLLIP